MCMTRLKTCTPECVRTSLKQGAQERTQGQPAVLETQKTETCPESEGWDAACRVFSSTNRNRVKEARRAQGRADCNVCSETEAEIQPLLL